MNVLSQEKQARVIAALVEGNSIRATERLTETHRDTVMRLGLRVGEGCEVLHDRLMVNLHVNILEADELWAFIGKKQGSRKADDSYELGDSYTFLGIDATNKAIVSYHVGKRTIDSTETFVNDLRKRVVNRPQITTDAFKPYLEAIDAAFGADCDYGQVMKEFRGTATANAPAERRYSPAKIIRMKRTPLLGNPARESINTSFVERSNLTVRMQSRRFTRLTNGFSKKLRNHAAAVALFVAHYNFCRIHSTVRMTPAMALGVTDHVWSIEELIDAALSSVTEIPPPADPSPAWPGPMPKSGPAPSKAHPRLKLIRGGVS